MSLQQKIDDMVLEAKTENVELPQLGQLIAESWAKQTVSVWDASGMSHPEHGLVRFRELEELRDTYRGDGQEAAALSLEHTYACIPGANACAPGSPDKAVALNCINGTFKRAMMFGDWEKVFDVVEVPNNAGFYYGFDYNRVIPGAFCIPTTCTTAAQCVAFMKDVAKHFLV